MVEQPGAPAFVGGELVPWEPIAELKLGPHELVVRARLRFQHTFDGLDFVQLAVVDLDSGRRIALLQHRGSPPSSTLLYVLPQQFTSATDLPGLMTAIDQQQDVLIEETLTALGLAATEVVWRRPIGTWRAQQALGDPQP